MHNREDMDYADFPGDILNDLLTSVEIAHKAGISDDKIILDPGIGFPKTYEMNLIAINRLDIIRELGYPVLLGASRKSVVGITLGLPETERLEGSLAAVVIGIMRGCSFVRVHDVKDTKRVVRMTEAVLGRANSIDNG
jgi:dihydropteroate synthase